MHLALETPGLILEVDFHVSDFKNIKTMTRDEIAVKFSAQITNF